MEEKTSGKEGTWERLWMEEKKLNRGEGANQLESKELG